MVVTHNASLAIEGTAGPLLIANAGTCNLRLPSDNAWLPVQPCHITSDQPLERAVGGATAVAQQAGAFNATCRFDRSVYGQQGRQALSLEQACTAVLHASRACRVLSLVR